MEKGNRISSWNRVWEIELVYRSKVGASDRPKIQPSRNSYEIIFSSLDPDKIELIEQFKIVLLNRAYAVLGNEGLRREATGTVVDIRLVWCQSGKSCTF